jgi:anaerobic selenocysteine-containing dehydrogenase
MTRSEFLRLATRAPATAGGAPLASVSTQRAGGQGPLALAAGGVDFSPATGVERQRIPSACWQCVTRCAIIGHLEEGRVVKIEGNPQMLSTGGTVCARGQAGVNQVYHPDRVLHPLKRLGRRGEGRWQRISWKEALDLLVDGGEIAGRRVRGLGALRAEGVPEKLMFHYGRMVGSDATIILSHFLPRYGTGTIGTHDSICMMAGDVGSELTGDAAGVADYRTARIVLNFGASEIDAGTNHVARARAWVAALARGARMVTFDVRLSNTAAHSSEWVPVKPGTDLAVALAMCRVLLDNGLHDTGFIRDHTNVTVAELIDHLSPYSPGWAEAQSGVPAAKIVELALELGRSKPGMCISARGAYMHANGVQTQRAIELLRVLSGNVAATGTRLPRVRWAQPFPVPKVEPRPPSLGILGGDPGAFAIPSQGVSHQIAHMIDVGPERPDIYLVYCHNPVYSNGDCHENARLYANEEKIPFLVSIDVAMSETTELADLVLPDATYLERWTLEGKTSQEGVPEYYLRQPMHAPLGEARNFVDVVCDVSQRLGLDLGFSSAEQFVRSACDATPGVREAGGFAYMKARGIWHDHNSKPVEYPRDRVSLRSRELEAKGFAGIAAWMPVPGHEVMAEDELVLTTFKVPVQTQSRTQGCKWLSELYHENPAWIHPRTAAARGIADGDRITVRSAIGSLTTRARVTEGVHPRAVAISHSAGHWAWGEYASGWASAVHDAEADGANRWWTEHGAHPNNIIPNVGDPIAGSMCWMDTVVRIEPAREPKTASGGACSVNPERETTTGKDGIEPTCAPTGS